MDRRTFEGPMEWEYQDTTGPVDVTSPFAQIARSSAQNPFSSPSRMSTFRPNNLFAAPSSPSRQPTQPPQASLFAPKIQPGQTAPPFRNPAFTTPRKPFDEPIFSEASGAESSPAFTDASPAPNDTPDLDRMTDLNMGTVTPSKVDKAFRYGRSTQSRRHAPGRGEIPRNHRDVPGAAADSIRKRKRLNYDRDVGSVRLHRHPEWENVSEEDSEHDDPIFQGSRSPRKPSGGRPAAGSPQKGWLRSLFAVMDDHPNAPDNIYNWIRLLLNVVLAGVLVFLGWSIYDTVRTDVGHANEAARSELTARILHCQSEYTVNQCAKKDRPALKMACDEWYECMNQDPAAVMRVRVTAKQIAEVINEFSGAMHLKAWAFFFGIIFLCILANNLSWGRATQPPQPAPAVPSQSVSMAPPDLDAAHFNPDYVWMQTPHRRRLAQYADEATDTDGMSPPEMKAIMYTPSMRRRSPSKGDGRQHSPSKYMGSPSKSRGF